MNGTVTGEQISYLLLLGWGRTTRRPPLRSLTLLLLVYSWSMCALLCLCINFSGAALHAIATRVAMSSERRATLLNDDQKECSRV